MPVTRISVAVELPEKKARRLAVDRNGFSDVGNGAFRSTASPVNVINTTSVAVQRANTDLGRPCPLLLTANKTFGRYPSRWYARVRQGAEHFEDQFGPCFQVTTALRDLWQVILELHIVRRRR